MKNSFAVKLFMRGLLAGTLLSGLALSACAEFSTRASTSFMPDPIMPAECYQLPKGEWELRMELAGACRRFNLARVECLLDAGISPEGTRRKKSELEFAICSTRPESVALVELLVRKGANVESLGGISGDKKLFKIALQEYLSFEQKKAKILALINGGAQIDFDAVQKAKEYGLARLDSFYRELSSERRLIARRSSELKSIVQRAIENGMCRIEEAQKYGLDPYISRAEWDQLEQVIKNAQEMRDQRCAAVQQFLPIKELAALVGQYERGPAGEYDDMPELEDVPEEELEDGRLES